MLDYSVINLLVILSAVTLTFFQSAFYVVGQTVEKVKKIKRVKIALKVCTAFQFNALMPHSFHGEGRAFVFV